MSLILYLALDMLYRWPHGETRRPVKMGLNRTGADLKAIWLGGSRDIVHARATATGMPPLLVRPHLCYEHLLA
jgi:hypothetical protein